MKKFYINCQGGTGYNIALTHVLADLKKSGEEYYFAVLSPYFDVFESSPYVDAVYKPNEIRDFIFDANEEGAELIIHRLYDLDGFIKKQLNYTEAWHRLMHLPEGEHNPYGTSLKSDLKPETRYPNLLDIKSQVLNIIDEKKFDDFVIMQFNGGQSPLTRVPAGKDKDGKDFPDWSKVPYNYDNEPLKRHYPKEDAQAFISLFEKAHPKTGIIMYQLPNEPAFEGNNIITMVAPYLMYYLLSKESKCRGIVSIDSSLQHLTAGNCKAVVLWGHSINASSSKLICNSFGYSYNTNIIQPCRRDDILYFSALGPSGAKIFYISPNELLKITDDYLFGNQEAATFMKIDGEYKQV